MTSAGGRWQTQEKSGGAVLSVRSPLHPACPIERGRWRSRGAGAAASGPSGAPGQSRLWTACSPAAAFRRQPCCCRAWLRLLPAWKPCHGPALPLCRMTSSGIRPWGKVGPGQAPAGLAGESGSRAARSPGGDAPDVPRRPHRLFVEKDPFRPAGPAACKTRQARLRRSMAPGHKKSVRTGISHPKPLPGPVNGAPRVPAKGKSCAGNHHLRDPADATRAS